MTAPTPLLCPAPDARREERDERSNPTQVLTHDEQIAEYIRMVDEARMRT